MSTRSLAEYRKLLEEMEGGLVPARFALDIVLAAEAELQSGAGECTVRQAMRDSGRSRSWFERRLPAWAAQGLARKDGGIWLLKRAAVPDSRGARARAYSSDADAAEIASALLAA